MREFEHPWGKEVRWAHTDRYLAKILMISKGHRVSLHYHKNRCETMYVYSGRGTAVIGEETRDLVPGFCMDVPAGTVHRLSADRGEDLVVLEATTPEPEDIVRIEDDYGRKG